MAHPTKRFLLVAAAILLLNIYVVSIACAGTTMQTINAYSGVKIIYNNQELISSQQPYIINDSTYVPLRMLIESFDDKSISWDPVNYRVIVNDQTSATEASLRSQLAQEEAELAALKKAISRFEAEVEDIESSGNDAALSSIEDTLNNNLGNAGNNYFADEGISAKITLKGDEDDLAYSLTLDFDKSVSNENLTELDQTKLKTFLNAVKSEISKLIDDTVFEDADITGKTADADHSNYYVKYDGSTYTFSYGDTVLSDVAGSLNDYFKDAGDKYFDDDGITAAITLAGDEDEVAYSLTLDFTNADDNDYLSDLTQNELKKFLNDVKSEIKDQIKGTDFEDANITGKAVDADYSGYYVIYNGSSYTFSFGDPSLSDIEDTLNDHFDNAGEYYFDDDGITATITLNGNKDDLVYSLALDFRNPDDHEYLKELTQAEIKKFLNAVKSEIDDQIDGTEFEDADITGKAADASYSNQFVNFNGSSYTFSWYEVNIQ